MKNTTKFDETVEVPHIAAASRTPVEASPHPKLVGGSTPALSRETNDLVRDRLRVAALLLTAGYAGFLIKDLVLGSTLEGTLGTVKTVLHVAMTAITAIVGVRLCTKCPHLMRHLRLAEVLVFGGSTLFFAVISYALVVTAAEKGYLVPITAPWIFLIFTYAILIPNTWRRALAVIAPMALVPTLTTILARFVSADVDRVMSGDSDHQYMVLESTMIMMLTTTISTYGVYVMRSLRTEAFEARRLGQYQLKRLLGRGGMGEVYIAEHLLLKRPCAIKLIRTDATENPQSLARFEREVQSTAKLTHWNTIEIYDYGRADDGTFYYVMEYLPGMNLQELVDTYGALPAARVVHLISQTCDALSEAHAEGLIHRDIKPANIFAAGRGRKFDVAKLLDFGLVRSETGGDAYQTQQQQVMGTPLFMSPEQAMGDRVDARSDIYSLGVVAYMLLTGRPPFEAETPLSVMMAHLKNEPPLPSQFESGIPTDVEQVIMRCLHKKPENRYQTADEFRQALQSCGVRDQWTWEDAACWWQAYGCPQKKKLDACVARGELPSDEASQRQQSLVAAGA